MSPTLRLMCALALLIASPTDHGRAQPAPRESQSPELDTEHMFGFTEGSDIGVKGEQEVELESVSRFGRQTGSYQALSTSPSFKYSISDSFRLSAGASFGYYAISGVPDIADTNAFVFQGLSLEARWRLLDREKSPVGLTLLALPFWGTVEPDTGVPADTWGAEFAALVDATLIPGKLFAAANLTYELGAVRPYATGLVENQSLLGLSLAFSAAVAPRYFIGVEARYMRLYDGLAFDALEAQALYIGPTFYFQITDGFSISGAWNFQAWGQSPDSTTVLDLVNFERNQVKFRLALRL